MTNHNGDAGKMSEEFYLPLIHENGVVEDDSGLFVADLASKEMDRAMCFAINNHDALVAQVELIKEALLDLSVRSSVINSSVCTDIISKALDGVE